MTTIQFTIDDTAHRFEVTPEHGDPNTVFVDAQTRIVDKVEELGYAFADGAAPDYQEFTKAFRTTEHGIDLGDLSGRVHPVDVTDTKTDDEDTATLELVGPDDESLEQSVRPAQNLGAVTAVIEDQYNLDLDEQVGLYPSADRDVPLATDQPVADLDVDTLYWDVTTVEEAHEEG